MITTTTRTTRWCALLGLGLAALLHVQAQQALPLTASPQHDQDGVDELLHSFDAKIQFTENKGQFTEGVLYRADFPLGQALATRQGMLITAYDPAAVQARQEEGMRIEQDMHDGRPSRPLVWNKKGHAWRMHFRNAQPAMTVTTRDAHGEVGNYFLGNVQAENVKSYQEVWYNDVYRQVDVRYYPAADGQLEYDVICKPGSDPRNVEIELEGIQKISVNEQGELVMSTSLGDMTFPAPVVYQRINGRERKVEASYRVIGANVLGFNLEEYDHTQPLVIDPIALRWATWVNTASTGDNHGHCIWVDPNDGAIYVVARVVGTTDQITVGAFDESANGNLEMIVGKYLEPATIGGSGTRVWQTYIGGNNDDNPYALEQGPDGNLYITGLTASTNFPLIGGAAFTGSSLDQQAQSGDDIFVLKINTAGNSIKSCVVGGNGTENSYDLRLTSAGDVLVCGGTTATNLLTLNAGSGASNTNNGGTDALVFKMNQDLSSLMWMRNYGGSSTDQPTIMLEDDATGDIFVGGHTTSTNFPTVTPRQATRGGTQAGFLQRLNSAGTTTWSSYFSSAASSTATILCMEFNTARTELYFGGLTTGLAAANISGSGVYDNSYNTNTDFYVCRMEIDQDFLASTYVGGTGAEANMMGLNTDQNNDVYVFGYTASTNFPTSALPNTALQTTNLGSNDKVFFKLESDLSALLFSTYYGGAQDDYDPVGERGIKFSNCRIYTIVTSRSNTAPLTQGALNTTKNSGSGIYEPGLVVWANPPDLQGNTITGTQNVCAGTVPDDITGSEPQYVLPTIVRNNVTSVYPSLGTGVTYQWQISSDSLVWNDIVGATSQNLLGSQIGVVNAKTYIRRIIGGDACILAGAADQVVIVNLVTITANITNTTCNGASNGSIQAISDGEAPFQYSWSNGQTTQTAINLAAGSYTVTVTDNNGCSASGTFAVGQPSVVGGSAQVTAATCGGNNGSATATGSGGTPGYTYLWNTGTVGATLSGVPSGSYSVTITDANLCSFILPVSIGGTAVPDANAGADAIITCLTGPSVQLNGSSSTVGAAYSWSGPGIVSGGSTATPQVNAAGNYILTVTAPNGCTSTDNALVTLNTAAPGANAGLDQTVNCTITSVVLDGSSATAGVGFSWSGPGGFTSTDEDPTVSAAGTYTLTVTDPVNGCSSTDQVAVNADNSVPNASAVGGELTCANTSVMLNGGSTTIGASFSWSGPGGFSSTDEDPIVSEPGTYTLTVTAPNGCTNTANVEVTEDVAQPNASAVGGELTCANTSVMLNGGSTTLGASFSWSGPGGFNSTDEDPIVSEPGTYTLTVTAPNGCANTANAEVTEDVAQPNASAVGGELTCANTSVMLNGGSTTPGVSFSWSGPGGFTSTDEDPIVSEPGTYTLTVTAPNGCTNTAIAEVTEDVAQPNVSAVGGELTCNTVNGIALNGGSTTPGVSFSWNGPGGSTSTDEDPTVTVSGTYILTVTAPNGCTNSANAEVTEDVNVPNATASGGELTCANTSVMLNGGSTTLGASFSWSGPGGFNSTDEDPIVSEPGTYTLTVTAPNGCTNTANAEVTEDVAQPNVSASGGVLSCNTENGITLNGGSTTSGVTFAWSGPGGFTSTDEDPTVNVPGTYTLTVTASNGCTNSANAEVQQDVNAPNVSAAGGELTCSITSMMLDGGSTTPGASFSWSGPGGFSSTDEDPVVSAPGVYTLTVTGPNGCTNSANAEVTEDVAQPNASAVGGELTCANTSVMLNGGSTTIGASFSWSGPGGFTSTDEDPIVSEPGTYTLTVTAPNGCTHTANAEVTEDVAQPNASAVGGELSCANTSVMLNGGSTTPGASFSWSGPGGFTSTDEDPIVSASGTYVLTVTGLNGCTNIANAEVTQDSEVPGASAVGGVLDCNNECVTLSGSGNGSFSWSGPGGFISNDQNPTVCTAGTYVLTVTGPNGCTSTAQASVTLDMNAPDISATGGVINCNEDPVQLNGGSSTPGAQFSWTSPNGFSSADEDPMVSEVGFYTLTVTGPNGCTNSIEVAVTHEDCNDDCGPLLICAPDTTVSCGTSLDYTVVGEPYIRKDPKCPAMEFVSWTDVYTGDCPVILTRTWTVGDVDGNVVTCVQTITIVDDIAPVLVGVPADVEISCASELPKACEVWAEDNCKSAWQVGYTEEINKGKGSCSYTVVRTWTATDDCGNSVSAHQVITVNDNEAPVFDCKPEEFKVSCYDVPKPPQCEATDNCDGSLEYTFEAVKSDPDDYGNWTLTWTWTATDDCDNTATLVQTVYVVCEKKPEEKEMNVTVWPNPFAHGTTITFTTERSETVTIDVFDSSGRPVKQLMNELVPAGSVRNVWFDTEGLGEGIYYYQLNHGGRMVMGRLVHAR